jgi:hypothetical protein
MENKNIEYKVKEYIPDQKRSFLRHSCDDLKEAVQRAHFQGDFTEVWSDNLETGETKLIYIAIGKKIDITEKMLDDLMRM